MIKWKNKPAGNCPVQAEGWFLGYYFYFRARYDKATIEFSKTEAGWDNDLLDGYYILHKSEGYQAGWLSHQKCKWLIYKGCLKFLFKYNKNKII